MSVSPSQSQMTCSSWSGCSVDPRGALWWVSTPCFGLVPQSSFLFCAQPSFGCKEGGRGGVEQFPRSVLTNSHKLDTDDNSNALSHSSGSWKSEIKLSAGPRSLRPVGERVLDSASLLKTHRQSLSFLGLQRHLSNPPSWHGTPPCVFTSSCVSPFYKNTSKTE